MQLIMMHKITISRPGYMFIEIICTKIENKLINGTEYKFASKYISKQQYLAGYLIFLNKEELISLRVNILHIQFSKCR